MKLKFNVSSASVLKTGLLMAFLSGLTAAQAQNVLLSDGNSSVTVNQGNGTGALGMNSWAVDGVNQLAQQWFWYRAGGTSLQSPINSIGGLTTSSTGNSLTSKYSNGQLSIQIEYILTGGTLGSGTADMQESITIFNNSSTALPVTFFQYSDFDLGGSPSGDSVNIQGDAVNGFYQASQSKTSAGISETVTLPYANRSEASLNGQLLNELNTVNGYNLNNVTSSGPGDASWGLQWNFLINPGSSVDVIKDKHFDLIPVPEPSVLAMLIFGFGGLMLRRRGRV